MKKLPIFISMILILIQSSFCQNNLTNDQIRQYANELGVPYESLQRLVDSHRNQSGLSNPNAEGAQFLSIRELDFMRDSATLVRSSYYRINALFREQLGRTVYFYDSEFNSIYADASFLLNYSRGTRVEALLSVRSGWDGKPREFVLVEIVQIQ